MADEFPSNPFIEAYNATFEAIRMHQPFVDAVKPGNFIRFSGAELPPDRNSLLPADADAQAILGPVPGSWDIFNSSDTGGALFPLLLAFKTDDPRIEAYYNIKFEAGRALARAIEFDLWQTEAIINTRLEDYVDNPEDPEADKGLEGWSGNFLIIHELGITKGDLIGQEDC